MGDFTNDSKRSFTVVLGPSHSTVRSLADPDGEAAELKGELVRVGLLAHAPSRYSLNRLLSDCTPTTGAVGAAQAARLKHRNLRKRLKTVEVQASVINAPMQHPQQQQARTSRMIQGKPMPEQTGAGHQKRSSRTRSSAAGQDMNRPRFEPKFLRTPAHDSDSEHIVYTYTCIRYL